MRQRGRRSRCSPAEVPTIADTVPGYGTPAEIIQKLNQETGLAEPRIKAWFDELGAEPMPMTVAEFRKFVADETGKWAKVVKFSGVKAD